MIKELTIAIILGAIVGFGATTSFLNIKKTPSEASKQPTPTLSTNLSINQNDSVENNPEDHNLIITNPEDQTVVDKDKIIIKGQTTPLSNLLIHTGVDTFFPETDETGFFQQEIELEAGANLIQISSLSPQENQIDKELLITFSTIDF